MTIREELRGALTNVLSNASNYPGKVQARLLGQDMGPLTERVTDTGLAVFEQAYTLTADDREALIGMLRAMPELVEEDIADAILAAGFRRPVQGEPTDAKRGIEEALAWIGRAWDDGNASGLDGWVGPGRGAGEVDHEAQHARTRMVHQAEAALRAAAGIGQEEKR